MTDSLNKCVCEICGISAQNPDSLLTETGECEKCQRLAEKGASALTDFLAPLHAEIDAGFPRRKANKAPYDVLMMFSGGKDSSLVSHSLSEDHGLRVLLFNLQFPFMSDTAKANLGRVASALSLDLMTFRIVEEVWGHVLRTVVKDTPHYVEKYKLPRTAYCAFGCIFCGHFHNVVATNLAARMGIPYIADGQDLDQIFPFGNSGHLSHPPVMTPDSFREALGGDVYAAYSDILSRLRDGAYLNTLYDLTPESTVGLELPTWITPGALLEVSQEARIKRCEDLGILDKKSADPAKTNCSIVPMWNFVNYKRYGIPYHTYEYRHWNQRRAKALLIEKDLHKLLDEYENRDSMNTDMEKLREQRIPFYRAFEHALELTAKGAKFETPEDVIDALDGFITEEACKIISQDDMRRLAQEVIETIRWSQYFDINVLGVSRSSNAE